MKDLDTACGKAEQLRTIYRMKHKELRYAMKENDSDEVGPKGEKELVRIKDYILKLKNLKKRSIQQR